MPVTPFEVTDPYKYVNGFGGFKESVTVPPSTYDLIH
jgi:hypothetical protein